MSKAELNAKAVLREAWLEVPDDYDMYFAKAIAESEGYVVIKVDDVNRRLYVKIGESNGS